METKEYIISVFTENHPGILYRVASVFLRRKINIESFKVSDSPIKDISLFTIVVYVGEDMARALVRQMRKLVGVLKTDYYTAEGQLSQEVALFKVRKEIFRGDVVEQIGRRHPFRLLQMNGSYVVLRKSGYKEEIDALRDELKERGLLVELSRSGSIILHRETIEESMTEIL
ncbi:MAG: acetolactate synthase small subunit [Rikenellaceae bacterium]|jgi:acetolactate synthase-1/3 small subunit|nr:acetolactate synthase small subunit [Rikenellaceae bacterium]